MAELDRQVGASEDDITVRWDDGASSWIANLTAGEARVGYAAANYQKFGGGKRFTNITIPKGSTITAAYLTIRCASSESDTVCKSIIQGEDVDDAAQFSDLADYQGRTRTTALVYWDSIPAWTADTDYDSPEIKTIIQEIIDREGWASGQDIVIFWDDHDGRSDSGAYRRGYSYDGSSTYAPKLHIEYTPPTARRSHGYVIG